MENLTLGLAITMSKFHIRAVLVFTLAVLSVTAWEFADELDELGISLLQVKGEKRRAVTRGPTRSVIIDTDVDIDDMMAIIYSLNEPSFDVRAITVETDGWSMQWAGLGNVMRLTQKYGRGDLPVAFPENYIVTQLNGKWGTHPNELPPPSYLNGTSTYLTDWVPTAYNPRPPSSMSAAELIIHTMREAPGTVDILALGPFTNLAAALHRDRDLFLSKLGTIYVSGGEINPAEPRLALKHRKAANSSAPGLGFPYYGQPPGANWNFFLDPISASQVVSSGAAMVFMADNAEDMITVNETDFGYMPQDCPAAQRQYLTEFYQVFGPACDETMSHVRYWDPSTAVLMKELMHTMGKGPASVCTEFRDMNLSVSLESGPHYAWIEQHSFGAPARVCLAANQTAFKAIYYRGACR